MLRAKLLFAAAALAAMHVSQAQSAFAQVRISPDLLRGDSVTAISISPDSRWVAMEVNVTRFSQQLGNLTADFLPEIFLARIDGTTSRSVSLGWLPPNAGMFLESDKEVFAPDSQHIAYFSGDSRDQEPRQLQIASAAGDVTIDVGAFTPDSHYPWEFRYIPVEDGPPELLVRTTQRGTTGLAPVGLFHVSLEDSSFTDLLPGVDLASRDSFQLVPQAGRFDVVAATRSTDPNEVLGLVGTQFAGGDPSPLQPPLAQDEMHPPHMGNDWQVTGNGQHVVYRATQNAPGVNELFSITLETGQLTPLSVAADLQHDVGDFRFAGPDSVLYTFKRLEGPGDDHGYRSLYAVPIEGGQSRLLYQGDPKAGDGRVLRFWAAPNGSHALIRERTHGSEQLLSVPTSGGTPTTLLDGLAALDMVDVSLQFTSDGSTAVFATERDRTSNGSLSP